MSQHILIVEDEEQVRSCLKEVLSDAGFDITEVGDGDRAIKMLDSPPRFDLLLTIFQCPASLTAMQWRPRQSRFTLEFQSSTRVGARTA